MGDPGPTERPGAASDALFREEALREYARVRSEGTLIRIHPAWTGWVFWLLVATFAGAALFAVALRVDRHLRAPVIAPAASAPAAPETGP